MPKIRSIPGWAIVRGGGGAIVRGIWQGAVVLGELSRGNSPGGAIVRGGAIVQGVILSWGYSREGGHCPGGGGGIFPDTMHNINGAANQLFLKEEHITAGYILNTRIE